MICVREEVLRVDGWARIFVIDLRPCFFPFANEIHGTARSQTSPMEYRRIDCEVCSSAPSHQSVITAKKAPLTRKVPAQEVQNEL